MRLKDEFYLVLANLIFACLGIFTRIIGDELLPVSQVSFRLIIASVILFGIGYAKEGFLFLKITKKDLFYLFLAGFLGYGVMVVFVVLAYLNTGYANAAVFAQTSTIFVMGLSWLILKEKITPRAAIAAILSIIGVVVAFSPDLKALDAGIAFAILSGFFYAFYFVYIRKLRALSIYTRLFYTTFLGGVLLVPFIFLFESHSRLSLSSVGIAYLVLMAVMNLIAYFLMNKGLKNIEANKAGILGASQTIFAILISYVLYNEAFSFAEGIGAAMIICSLFILNIKKNDTT